MPSEWEIRKLYVKKQTVCIEFFFSLLGFFSVRRTRGRHRRWRSWGFGGYPSTSILAGAIRPKSQNMYMFALLAGFSYPVFLPFRAVFLQTRKEEAYTSSFSSSASFNLMAPSMTPSTMGRYFSGQSCNLWLVRWRCSLSSRSSSGLK